MLRPVNLPASIRPDAVDHLERSLQLERGVISTRPPIAITARIPHYQDIEFFSEDLMPCPMTCNAPHSSA